MTRLSERAMLAALHISSYSGLMYDQKATEEFNEQQKADRTKAGRYNKKLVAPQFLAGVNGAHHRAGKVHKLLTLPWEDNGTRILTARSYMSYTEKMKACRLHAEEEVKKFIDTFDEAITEAEPRLGKLFCRDDYPTVDELKAKFDFDVEFKGISEANDFRAELSQEQMKSVVKEIEARSNDRVKHAMNDVFDRIAGLVRNMSEKLRDYVPPKDGDRAQGIIRDTVVYNINELCEVLPSLNIIDDPRIEQLRQQLKAELVEHSPEVLRADAKIRQQTISKADKLLKKVEAYMK